MLGVSVQTFMQRVGHAIFLCPFIWNHVSGLMQFCDRFDKGTVSIFVQILESVQRRLGSD
jgi:hypothetical protein